MQRARNPVLYKNRLMSDVAAQIKFIGYRKEDDAYEVFVSWWNIGDCHEPHSMNIDERIKIPIETWKRDWSIYKSGNS